VTQDRKNNIVIDMLYMSMKEVYKPVFLTFAPKLHCHCVTVL